ncbi:MAG: hypothetical protein MJK04_13340 [Psychrosphaera sp.]|nr:hypothetical protein [Psychrosphaera sp.]
MKIETETYMKKQESALDEAVALLKLLSIAENSAQNEPILSKEDIKAKLAKRREVLLQSK